MNTLVKESKALAVNCIYSSFLIIMMACDNQLHIPHLPESDNTNSIVKSLSSIAPHQLTDSWVHRQNTSNAVLQDSIIQQIFYYFWEDDFEADSLTIVDIRRYNLNSDIALVAVEFKHTKENYLHAVNRTSYHQKTGTLIDEIQAVIELQDAYINHTGQLLLEYDSIKNYINVRITAFAEQTYKEHYQLTDEGWFEQL